MVRGCATRSSAFGCQIVRASESLGEDFASVTIAAGSHFAGTARPVLGSSLGEEIHLRHDLPGELAGLVLSHELAHVVQRRNAARCKGRAGSAAELEAEADRAALAVAAGRRFVCRLADVEGGPRAWAVAGHYYTCYFVMLAAGVEPALAAKQACFAQMPDQVAEFDAIVRGADYIGRKAMEVSQPLLAPFEQRILARDIDVQAGLHCLTGGGAEAETRRRRDVIDHADLDSFDFGLGLHPFGDSYAHRTLNNPDVLYSAPLGHARDKHEPDKIDRRPDLYVRYGQDLYDVVVRKRPGKARLDRAGVGAKLRSFAAISSTPDEGAEILQIRLGAMGDLSTPNNPAGFVVMESYKPELEDETIWYRYRRLHGFGPQVLADTMRLAQTWAVPATS